MHIDPFKHVWKILITCLKFIPPLGGIADQNHGQHCKHYADAHNDEQNRNKNSDLIHCFHLHSICIYYLYNNIISGEKKKFMANIGAKKYFAVMGTINYLLLSIG
jgi:hypothetical protein